MTPLRQRMLDDLRVRNRSPYTQRAYVESVARFARHFGRSPGGSRPGGDSRLPGLPTTERKLAPSTIVIAVSALRFLYRVTLRRPWSFDDVEAETPPHQVRPEIARGLPCVLAPVAGVAHR